MQYSRLAQLIASGLLCVTCMTTRAAAPTHPALRDELLAMRARDQAVRHTSTMTFKSEEEFTTWAEKEKKDRQRLKEILDREGWPTISMVGADGAEAAWLIVQHSDDDPDFQRRILELIAPLAASGQADPKLHAYLHDRTHYPQRFGTQGGCVSRQEWRPFDIEDIANVDQRRRQLGMPPLAEYARLFDCSAPGILLHPSSDPRRTVALPAKENSTAR